MPNARDPSALPVSKLKELLDYDSETGLLTWKPRLARHMTQPKYTNRLNNRIAGKIAGTINKGGYVVVNIQGRQFAASRIAYALAHGRWPRGIVDHINGNKADNRIINLRSVSASESCKNLPRSSANTSGVVGVSWNTGMRRWIASITLNSEKQHLGSFVDRDDAISARKAAEKRFGFHPNHGREQ